ncbi:hypothetical protein [Marinomonas sp.]|uniref:hypothetical protein n=1 Tax=Marinomonas sp. TaxID=1904862 RepID=UPI003BABAFB3
MSEYFATVEWKRGSQVFSDKKYSRAHEWQFEGGVVVPASSKVLHRQSHEACFIANSVLTEVQVDEAFCV